MKTYRSAACILALTALSATGARGTDGNIGLFFDTDATRYCLTIPCQEVGTLYVFALLSGASRTGITGAEYKIRTGPDSAADPAGFLYQETFDPSSTVLGSGALQPVDPSARGVGLAWPTCQVGDGYKVLIETVGIFNSSCSTNELHLLVVKHDTPTNQYFQCPLFTLCDEPAFTKVCLGSNLTLCRNPEPPFPNNATCSTSGNAYLNPIPSRCVFAVQPSTWSVVKQLYRG